MREESPTAVVLVLDGLGSGYLGPYGNTWIETPAFNELACQSCLFEQAIVDSPSLDGLYRSLWTGRHAAAVDGAQGPGESLLEQLGRRGCSTLLITDEPDCAGHALADAFEGIQLLTSDERCELLPAEETGIARIFAETIEAVSGQAADLIWVHSRALQAAWDAPLEFRLQFADEEDPDPPISAEPPALRLGPESDPDVVQGWLWAYAGQIVLLDLCLQPLLAALDALDPSPLFILTGARGYPLGEHGALGSVATGLYTELLQVPLLIRLPTGQFATHRIPNLVQPANLSATLMSWFDGVVDSPIAAGLWPLMRETTPIWPELAVSQTPTEWALRTPTWFARIAPKADSSPAQSFGQEPFLQVSELFLKPDDRWDVNDVSDRCPEVIQAFHRLWKELPSQVAQDGWPHNLPLETVLFRRP